jgi:SEC-C motif-containing protein
MTMPAQATATKCPCGSGEPFARCCEPFLEGAAVPETAEKTMRARYTAHTTANVAFLMATLHEKNRGEGEEESVRRWAQESEWLGLEILSTEKGGAKDDEGVVEFVCRYRDRKGVAHAHHELSTFVKEDGRWLFREGHTPAQETLRREAPKVGRNDPCPCGSGKKFKKCCEAA